MDISTIASVTLSPSNYGSTGGTGAGTLTPTSAAPPPSTGSAPAATTSNPSESSPSKTSLAQAIKQVNNSFSESGQNLTVSFGKDKQTGIDIITFTDTATHQVVSQIPSKAMIAMAQALSTNGKMGQGQLLSQMA